MTLTHLMTHATSQSSVKLNFLTLTLKFHTMYLFFCYLLPAWLIQPITMCVYCGSVGRVGHLVIGRSPVRIPAPSSCMSKCPWARYWTPSCSWWAVVAVINVCMCVWMGNCGMYCMYIMQTIYINFYREHSCNRWHTVFSRCYFQINRPDISSSIKHYTCIYMLWITTLDGDLIHLLGHRLTSAEIQPKLAVSQRSPCWVELLYKRQHSAWNKHLRDVRPDHHV